MMFAWRSAIINQSINLDCQIGIIQTQVPNNNVLIHVILELWESND